MSTSTKNPVVCSVGSSDPTAGAGLFADAAVYARLGVRPTFVVAGVTAQNSARVSAVHSVPPKIIRAQLEAVWAQVRPAAMRIGLLPDTAAVNEIARFLRSLRRRPPVVLDPVIAATAGHRFAGASEIRALRRLLALTTIATPNADEAAEVARMPVRDVAEAERAALVLAGNGCAVLITGGHLAGDRIVDVLVQSGRVKRYSARRLPADVRGTGCMLSAALAAMLARGYALDDCVRRARAFVRRAISHARPLGRGRPQFAGAGVRALPV